MAKPISRWRAVLWAMRTWRTAAVSLLSFSSGLPLGLVWIAIPTWMARQGIDVKIIGLFTLAQAPWTFKFLWSPLMDRYSTPLPRMGCKAGWTLLMQIALLILTLGLAGAALHPDLIWMIGALTLAIAFASASQDIAIDAYAVEVLRPEEQGVAVGARVALYRAAMFISGGAAISLAALWSWTSVFVFTAALYIPLMGVSIFAPQSEYDRSEPPRSLRAAIWEPLVGFLRADRALEILAFVVLYKLADNLAGALIRPFLVQVGFNDLDVGIATASIGLAATLAGTFLGGILTAAIGLGHALWLFGVIQILSNSGYVAVAEIGLNRPVMYAAMGLESLATGMGTGAFSVLLLRMTQKRFSATQYALFSSLFALPRLIAGPVTGVMVDAIGWRNFFLFSMVAGLPGLMMLQKFSPLGSPEPLVFQVTRRHRQLISRAGLVLRAATGGILGLALGTASAVLIDAMRRFHQNPATGFDLSGPLVLLVSPQEASGWMKLLGVLFFGLVLALAAAATAAARSEDWPVLAPDQGIHEQEKAREQRKEKP